MSLPLARFQWKKTKDDRPTIVCIRADGSRTWARLHPFFPLHDLRHYAVETTLGFREAFFGLVATTWSIEEFNQPGATDRLPQEAKWAEQIVGLLDLERSAGTWEIEAFNTGLAAALAAGNNPPCHPVTAEDLVNIRSVYDRLAGQWLGLPLGGELELEWPG